MDNRKALLMVALVAIMGTPCVFANDLEEIRSDVKEIKEMVTRMDARQYEAYGRINSIEARATGQASASAVIVSVVIALGFRCIKQKGRCANAS